jgi:hypothetical protein
LNKSRQWKQHAEDFENDNPSAADIVGEPAP